MLLDSLFEFSRQHCISICALLIPLNLLTTSFNLLLVYLGRSLTQIRIVALIASIFALGLFIHVISWLVAGIVMLPTFVLPFLGTICIAINLWVSAVFGGAGAAKQNTTWFRGIVNRLITLAWAKLDLHPVKRLLVALGAEE